MQSALTQYVAVLKRQEEAPSNTWLEETLKFQEAVAYTKLEAIANDRGDRAAAAAYQASAEALCPKLFAPKPCSAAKIVELANRIEQQRKISVLY